MCVQVHIHMCTCGSQVSSFICLYLTSFSEWGGGRDSCRVVELLLITCTGQGQESNQHFRQASHHQYHCSCMSAQLPLPCLWDFLAFQSLSQCPIGPTLVLTNMHWNNKYHWIIKQGHWKSSRPRAEVASFKWESHLSRIRFPPLADPLCFPVVGRKRVDLGWDVWFIQHCGSWTLAGY